MATLFTFIFISLSYRASPIGIHSYQPPPFWFESTHVSVPTVGHIIGGQTDRPTDGQTMGWMDGQMEKWTDLRTSRGTDLCVDALD